MCGNARRHINKQVLCAGADWQFASVDSLLLNIERHA
jgi:hypothetical protein